MNKLYYILSSLLFISCSEQKSLESSLINTSQTLKRGALLYKTSSNGRHAFFEKIDYHLYDQRNDGDVTKTGWIEKGEKIKILEVNYYHTDTRGKWVGVVGEYENLQKNENKTFIYCWSSGDRLKVAPWEILDSPDSVTTRDIKNVFSELKK